MNVSSDLGFLALLSNASILVKLVMVILLGMSMVSLWHMIRKLASFRETLHQCIEFEQDLQGSTDFDALYRLGTVYEKEGRKADAVAEYTAAVRADYGNGPAVAALTRLGAPVPAAPAPLAVPPAPMPKAPALPVPNGAASPSGSQPPASKTRPAPVAPAK